MAKQPLLNVLLRLASRFPILMAGFIFLIVNACNQQSKSESKMQITAKEILGNPKYQAISYGSFRELTRDSIPTVEELKEDIRILHAMGIKLLRTYHIELLDTERLLQAISEEKKDNPNFEMYVMLGSWIDCKNARMEHPIHHEESERNEKEINGAVALANQYPDIVKIIAVGNEAMVKWATGYFVEPHIILKWVNHLQDLKKGGKLPKNLWITSSDNFASWGGGDKEYHVQELNDLIKAVDFISMHTYPMHDTHYHPVFWGVRAFEDSLTDKEKVDAAMLRSKAYVQSQYANVVKYMKSIGVNKPVHIGETGWATQSNEFYGPNGAKAIDEYKMALYYHHIREWTNKDSISCFYFEAFDEQWKDANNPGGSENHFGLINLKGEAKYAIWNLVDNGTFKGLTRGGFPITKTFGGDTTKMMQTVLVPPTEEEIAHRR